MRGAMLIVKKEFMELFKDRKTLFFTIAFPLLIYPMLFLMMGKLHASDREKRESKPSRVYLVDPGQVVAPLLSADPTHFELVGKPQGDLKQALLDEKLEISLEVPPEAPELLKRQETLNIKATADLTDDSGHLAMRRLKKLFAEQDSKWVKARLEALNASKQLAEPTKIQEDNAGNEGRNTARLLGMLLPYMLLLMMFVGALQPGIYVTAGEKERGTLQSLLATSLPRTQIILGKLLYIFAMGVIVAVLNLLSMAISLGKLGSMEAGAKAAATAAPSAFSNLSALANPSTIILVLLLVIPLGLLFANIILLGGIQAKNSQEAGTALMPAIAVVLFLGIFSMAPGLEKMAFLPYIPVVNVSLAIRKLILEHSNILEYCIALVMTVGLAGLLTYASSRLLNRESVLFKV